MDVTEDSDDLTLSMLIKRNTKKKDETKVKKNTEINEDWIKEKNVFELQLNQLQEQLVAAMLQNQQLEEQNKKLMKNNVGMLSEELEEERSKRKKVEERMKRLLQQKAKVPSKSDASFEHDFDDLSSELGEKLDESGLSQNVDSYLSRRKRFYAKLLEYKITTWNFFHERISDFMNDEEQAIQEEEEEQLSVRRLRENVARFSDAIQPIKSSYYSAHGLFSWSNPWLTILIFLIYAYSLWIEMSIPLLLMLILLQLSINYLHARGIAQRFTKARRSTSEKEEIKEEQQGSSLSERYQLVLQIARKVQNTLGRFADNLEKIQNLLLWQHEEASKKLYYLILFLFVVSCFLPTNLFMMVVGFMAGVKLFFITPIYTRFPKVQARCDDVQRLWEDLPTHAQNLQRKVEEDEDVKNTRSTQNSPELTSSSSSTSSPKKREEEKEETVKQEYSVSWETIIFCDRFQLPKNEIPMPDWVEGRRCTLMDKENPLTSMRHGRLYLTTNFLCFERNQYHSKKNIAIALADIISLRKAKPISFMPGPGMAIEIEVKDVTKPYMFAAMMGREEAFDAIVKAGKLLNLPWSKRY